VTLRLVPSLALCLTLLLPTNAAAGEPAAPDVAAARKLFEANLDAIRRKDRSAYLACYLESETLARTGPEGFQTGFDSHARQTSETSWPDLFEAHDLQLVPVRPGVVYGTYRYRVKYGDEEHQGLSERVFIKTPTGWKIAVSTAFDSPAGTPPPPRALVGATLVDGTGAPPVPDAVVLLRGGKIDCAGARKRCPVPEGVDVLDLKGNWITPGIVDAHVHFSQTGWADGRPDALDLREQFPYEGVQASLRAHPERWFRSYLCSGVTAVYDVGGYPWTLGLTERAEKDTRAPHVAAAGPLLSTRDHWLNLPAERQFIYLSDEATATQGVRYLKEHGAAAVKVWFITGTDRPFEQMASLVAVAGAEAGRLGIPLIVHATELEAARVALRAGARMLVHSVGDAPVDDDFIQLLKANHTIYCPTLTVTGGYQRMFASVAEGTPPPVDDPSGCVDGETLTHIARTPVLGKGRFDVERWRSRAADREKRTLIAAANLKRIFEAGIPVATGTDAGNPLTLHGPSIYGEMEAMQEAGLTPMQVLVASTKGGAMAMGRQDLGTVEKDKIADLLVVAEDPLADISNLRQLRCVVRGGVVRRTEELRPMGAQ
jgi:imidazolonepropionase-like amidohydrolase